jgi:hypothetical protein
MNRMWLLVMATAYPLIVLAQSGSVPTQNPPYQPAVPVAPTVNQYGGGWGGSSGGGTVAGSALNGMANVISSKGNYNLSTSAAAINMTQAQRNEIQNWQMSTKAYFDMRELNRQSRAAERGPTPTMEQLARLAKEGLPKPLGPKDLNPVDGQLLWPGALQQPNFESGRDEIDQLFVTRARYGGLGYADQMKVIQAVDTMHKELKAQIQQIPPQDYMVCRSFLNSVTYAAAHTEME